MALEHSEWKSLLVKDIPSRVSDDTLELYLENVADGPGVTDVTRLQNDTTCAVVTYDSPVDIETVKNNSSIKPLSGGHIAIEPIPPADCILVTNVADTVQDELLELYFEAGKSGGGDVKQVWRLPSQSAAVVQFEDKSVLESVLSKKHVIEKHSVAVEKYDKLTQPFPPKDDTRHKENTRKELKQSSIPKSRDQRHGISSGHSVLPSNSYGYDGIEIQRSSKQPEFGRDPSRAVEGVSDRRKTSAGSPFSGAGSLSLMPKSPMPGQQVAKPNVQPDQNSSRAQNYMNYASTTDKLGTYGLEEEMARPNVRPDRYGGHVQSHASAANKSGVYGLEEDMEWQDGEGETGSGRARDLGSHRTLMLIPGSNPPSYETSGAAAPPVLRSPAGSGLALESNKDPNYQKTAPHQHHRQEGNKSSSQFSGEDEVDEMPGQMDHLRLDPTETRHDASENQLASFGEESGGFHSNDEGSNVVGNRPPRHAHGSHLHHVHSEPHHENSTGYHVYRPKTQTASLDVKKGIWRLLIRNQDILTGVFTFNHDLYEPEFTTDDKYKWSVIFQGLDDAPHKVKEALNGYIKQIEYRVIHMKKPGLLRLMTRGVGKDWIDAIEKSCNCCIEVRRDHSGGTGRNTSSRPTTMSSASHSRDQQHFRQSHSGSGGNDITFGNVTLCVQEGNIVTQRKVDVLVNPVTGHQLYDSGAISRAFAKAGGRKLQEMVDQQGGIADDTVVITKASAQIYAKHVFHIRYGRWKKSFADVSLGNLVEQCLDEAERLEMSSIAFPPVGCGKMRYPVDIVAQIMTNETQKFGLKHKRPFLKEVFIIIYENHVHTKFSEAVRSFSRQSGTSGDEEGEDYKSKLRSHSNHSNSGQRYAQQQAAAAHEVQGAPITTTVFHINALTSADIRRAEDELNRKIDTDYCQDEFWHSALFKPNAPERSLVEKLNGDNMVVLIDTAQGKVYLSGVRWDVSAAIRQLEGTFRASRSYPGSGGTSASGSSSKFTGTYLMPSTYNQSYSSPSSPYTQYTDPPSSTSSSSGSSRLTGTYPMQSTYNQSYPHPSGPYPHYTDPPSSTSSSSGSSRLTGTYPMQSTYNQSYPHPSGPYPHYTDPPSSTSSSSGSSRLTGTYPMQSTYNQLYPSP